MYLIRATVHAFAERTAMYCGSFKLLDLAYSILLPGGFHRIRHCGEPSPQSAPRGQLTRT